VRSGPDGPVADGGRLEFDDFADRRALLVDRGVRESAVAPQEWRIVNESLSWFGKGACGGH
jgi:hypothetical protein